MTRHAAGDPTPQEHLDPLDLAVNAYMQGRDAEADAQCMALLERDSGNADAWNLRAAIASGRGDVNAALQHIAGAIALDPTNSNYHFNLGMLHKARGDLRAAVDACAEALHFQPGHGQAMQECLHGALALGDYALIERVLLPLKDALLNNADLCSLLALALEKQDRKLEALPYLEHLSTLRSTHNASYYASYIGALSAAGRFADAIAAGKRAIAENIQVAAIFYNMARAYELMGDFEQAECQYDRALSVDFQYRDAHFARAMMALKTGNLRNARELYRARFTWGNQMLPPAYLCSRWEGQDLAGKKILLSAEQGFGDIIMFSGFLPYLMSKAAQVAVALYPRMIPLFARSFPGVTFYRLGEGAGREVEMPATAYDYHAPMGDLLQFCLEAYQPRTVTGYLKADNAMVARLRKKYDAMMPGLKIGIAWQTANDATSMVRNISLPLWKPIFETPNCHFISLQYGDWSEMLEHFRQETGHAIYQDAQIDQVANPDHFAAQTAAMDRVISIQNSAVHMAGSLGIPTTILLPKTSDFRWGIARQDNPWYGSVQIVRQEQYGDWSAAIACVAEELRRVAG